MDDVFIVVHTGTLVRQLGVDSLHELGADVGGDCLLVLLDHGGRGGGQILLNVYFVKCFSHGKEDCLKLDCNLSFT